ncbi:GerMN domain-containing protein [Priestia taiwanensis]|uniref:Sporulation protein n=1 Tax=Priestia taiwanensis TaxID=1347902 RepID=A0A917AU60_9BACI|nr:GerMN domain-containing protein [Priestia taiwanensis]MBM7363549.1 germination protein M [Priestia taiwanensis]GGE76186.1 sporulation protein [Priestia taiwanensis]
MKQKKSFILGCVVLLCGGLLSACGINYDQVGKDLNGEKQPAQEAKKEEGKEESKENKEAITNGTEIYLIDKHGYVVPQTVAIPKEKATVDQVLQYLVEDGPVANVLPNGFRAVLPAGTEMKVKVEKEVATIDFNPEFQKYKAEDEAKILQAVTWTLTQFENVKKVKFQVNGSNLAVMPVAKSPIGDGLTRANGINFDYSNTTDVMNTRPVVVYFLSENAGGVYYVPVTRRAPIDGTDMLTAAVNELIKGEDVQSELVSDLEEDVKLLGAPQLKDGVVTLNFNENITSKGKISEHTLKSLVLSLTEQKDVKKVVVQVNGKTDVLDDKGEKITEPVSRPQKVNTGSY